AARARGGVALGRPDRGREAGRPAGRAGDGPRPGPRGGARRAEPPRAPPRLPALPPPGRAGPPAGRRTAGGAAAPPRPTPSAQRPVRPRAGLEPCRWAACPPAEWGAAARRLPAPRVRFELRVGFEPVGDERLPQRGDGK